MKQGEGLLGKSRKLLGEDDPVHERFETAMRGYRKTHKAIVSFVKNGEIIDTF